MTPPRARVRWSFTAALAAHVLLLALLFAALSFPRGDDGSGGDGVGLEFAEGNADVNASAVVPSAAAKAPQNPVADEDEASSAMVPPSTPRSESAVAEPARRMSLRPSGARSGDAFLARVRAHLARYRRELPPAIRGVQGVVQLRFSLLPNGEVTRARIAKSSGNAALDREALDLLLRAQPLPAREVPVELTVPIKFEKTAVD
ncbi:MAG: energy transducer TonB family protein [Stenotrophobium sp.]